jgi:Zn-dependent protease
MAEAVASHLRTGRAGERAPNRRPRGPGQSGFRLARISGIEIRVDWSLAIVLWLIIMNLGAGLFPARHPGWSPVVTWGTAVVAALLFFASVLAHEMAHALVGRRRGVPIEGITLFLFGGVARLGGEPKSAGSEFLIAIVGPLTSFAIAVLCVAGGLALAPGGVHGSPTLAALSPLATVLLWLGTTNFMLAVFNLLPGFPLDGGRVLRALLWKATGDVRKATRGATAAGRAIALLMIFAGVMMAFGARLPFLGGGLAQGLWLVLIGWFLNSAAVSSYRQLMLTEGLENVSVARLMRTEAPAVPSYMPVSGLVDRFFMQSAERCFPVIDTDASTGAVAFKGLVCMSDLRKIGREAWDRTPVREVMTPAQSLAAVRPDESAVEALRKLGASDVDQLPVIDQQGRLQGILRRADLLRWIELHGRG